MDLKTIELSKLNPADYNPREISKEEFEGLKESLKTFGQQENLIVNKDHTIISGHQRFEAMKALGWTQAVCNMVDLDKHQEKKLNVIMNSTAISGKYDDLKLSEILEDLKLDDDYESLRLDKLEPLDLSDIEVEEDESPEVSSEPPVSKLGEVYQLGRHRVMCGDSTNYVDVDRLMNEKKSELLFTSPPYSDMREYNGGKDLSVNNLTQFIVNFEPFCEYQAVNLGIQRKDNNINTYWDEYIEVAKKCGNKFLAWNVWVKPGAGSVGNQSAFFPIIHEWIFVFGHKFKDINRTEEKKTKEHRQNRKVRQADGSMKVSSRGFMGDKKELESVIFANPELGEIRQEHPATFSVDLPSKYIKSITNKEDIVCDPFLGSGTTLIACEQTDRICYGMELDPKYVDVIRKRYWKFTHDGNEEGWQDGTTNQND